MDYHEQLKSDEESQLPTCHSEERSRNMNYHEQVKSDEESACEN